MSEKLLIVEDDKKLNDGIRLALKDDAYFFYQCQTLQEAREILKKEDITLVLLDVNLPDGNGIDFVREIKKENKPKNFELCKEGDIAFADASEDTNEVAKAIEFYTLEDKKVSRTCSLF